MEDLYSNLENYDDVNAVDELKNENRELKHKLEECTNAMNQLQKDFDKLNSEYKKLEINYSSLLKTARAEIERKTQLITNLNKEKDMIVIRAMQSGRNVLKNVNKPVHNYKKNYTNIKDENNKEMLNKNKPGLSGNSREGSRDSPLLLMKDKVAPATNMSTSSEHNLRQLHDGHSKENMLKSAQYQTNDTNKPKTAKISARRKSMPVSSNWEKHISSEEDVIKNYNTNTRDLNKYKDYDNFRQNSQYLGSNGGQKINKSEQFTNETYNRGMDRYNPHFNRYTHNQKYSNYSPERGRPQQNRGSDSSHRSDYYRQRVLESPPKDNYNRSKSRERRPRERDHRRDFDYYNSRYEENYDTRSNIREPDLKRRRMDSNSMDRERRDQAAERRSYRLSEYRPYAAIEDHTSCQSPDYDQIESNLDHHSIKEIKNIATVPLEDPRINSRKYSLKESDQGTFITTVDKDICLLQVDKKLWGFENIEVPEALKTNIWEEPANEDIVNCIYMGIDDPACILSSKSSKNNTDRSQSESTGSLNSQGVCSKEYSTSDTIEQKLQKTNVGVSETIVSDYKMLKKSKVDVESNTSVQEYVKINDCNNFNRNLSLNDYKQCSNYLKNEISNYQLKSQKLAPVEHNVEGDLELSDEASDIADELQITCKQSDKFTHVSDRDKSRDVGIDGKCMEKDRKSDETQKKDKTVMEDDNYITSKNIAKQAAYSEEKDGKIQIIIDNEKASKEEASIKKNETCKRKMLTHVSDRDKSRDVGIDGKCKGKDHKNDETQKQDKTVIEHNNDIISKNIAKPAAHSKEKEGKIHINVDSEKASKEASLKKNETCKKKTSKKKCDGKSPENKDIKTNESSRIEVKETKKREKRKRLSSKETEQERKECKDPHINTGENVYENKPKDSKPYNKFTELFGESSSLITPEDLNIATKFDISIERHDNYVSLFENTQDAIDLHVREIKEVSQTDNNNLKVLENVEVHSIKDDKPDTIDEKSLFEIKGDRASDNVYKNLKPAIIDNESNIVKTVVISSGIQPCIEEKNINQKKLAEIDSNEAKEIEKVIKHQPLELLRAVATSTPNKMQHEALPRLTSAAVTPDGENFNMDSNLSYTASLTTSTNVEANSEAPDVRIFIKRRRKIKKI